MTTRFENIYLNFFILLSLRERVGVREKLYESLPHLSCGHLLPKGEEEIKNCKLF